MEGWKRLEENERDRVLKRIARAALKEREAKANTVIREMSRLEGELEKAGIEITRLGYQPAFMEYYSMPLAKDWEEFDLFCSVEEDGSEYYFAIVHGEEDSILLMRRWQDEAQLFRDGTWETLPGPAEEYFRDEGSREEEEEDLGEEPEEDPEEEPGEDPREEPEEDPEEETEEDSGEETIPFEISDVVFDMKNDMDYLKELVEYRRELLKEFLEETLAFLREKKAEVREIWFREEAIRGFLETSLSLVDTGEDWRLFRVGEYTAILTLDGEMPDDGALYAYVEETGGNRTMVPRVYIVGED